ncbi:hypothetical protein N2152v2_005249 [Parachlorella kessleri]
MAGRTGLEPWQLSKATVCLEESAAGRSSKARDHEARLDTTEEFHSYFGAQLGERWHQLYAVLARPTSHVALLNPFLGHCRAAGIAQQQLPGSEALPEQLEPWRAVAAVAALHHALPEGDGYPQPTPDPATGLRPWYWLDWASLVPPLALGAAPGHNVLDMCAAPGGKSLVLAQLLFSELYQEDGSWPGAQHARSPGSGSGGSRSSSGSRLVCNEIDAGRRRRLLAVLRDYVPELVRLQSIRVTPHDGAAFWRSQEPESYDRILLDAPCSSDRHIVQQAEAGSRRGSIRKADWSAKRCKAIAGDQAKLLAAAVKALRPGGRVVYSTCSLAEVENDGVVGKVLHKAGPALAVLSHTLDGASDSLSSSRRGGSSSSSSCCCHDAAQPAAAAAAAAGALQVSLTGSILEHPGNQQSVQHPGDPARVAGVAAAALAAVPGGAARCEWVTAADFETWGAERTQHGWLLLPDTTGFGPIYVCVLEKMASSDLKRTKVNKYACSKEETGGKHNV